MTDNNTHSILFELQKNLEDLSSAKTQMDEFRSSSKDVVQGISNIQQNFVKHLNDIELDYKERVNKLEHSLSSFLVITTDDNKESIKKIAATAEQEIVKGVEQFNSIGSEFKIYLETNTKENKTTFQNITKITEQEISKGIENLRSVASEVEITLALIKKENETTIKNIALSTEATISQSVNQLEYIGNKVETTNDKSIVSITNLLAHYKNVVEASHSLINSLTSIDFPSKLDAISSKSQLIIEAITNAKQSLEIKSNETQNSIIENTNRVKEQVVQNSDIKINLLTEKIVETTKNLTATFSSNFEQQSNSIEISFANLRTIFEEQNNQINADLIKQNREIKTLKSILLVTLGLVIIGIILNFALK